MRTKNVGGQSADLRSRSCSGREFGAQRGPPFSKSGAPDSAPVPTVGAVAGTHLITTLFFPVNGLTTSHGDGSGRTGSHPGNRDGSSSGEATKNSVSTLIAHYYKSARRRHSNNSRLAASGLAIKLQVTNVPFLWHCCQATLQRSHPQPLSENLCPSVASVDQPSFDLKPNATRGTRAQRHRLARRI